MTRFENASPAARTTLVVVGVLLLLLVAGTSTAMIALAGVGRLSPDIDPVRVPAWLWHYRADPDLQRWLRIGGLTNILLAVVLVAAVALGIRRPLHGAARWASTRDLKAAGLAAREGILLGRRGRSWLIAGGSEHVMLYAPTRTGKGVGVVIPNLLTWPGSVVVLDIKRENHAATAGFRAAAGQDGAAVRSPRPRRAEPHASTLWRTSSASLDLRRPRRVATDGGHALPRATITPTPSGRKPARTGFIGVGAYVAETPDLPFSLGEIFRQLTEGDARERFPGLIKARNLAGAPLSNGCASALTDFCSSSENTFASIRQTITSRMGLWLNPAVDAATSASDFDLRDLREGRLSLYLGASPDNMLRVAPLYSLLFQQLVDLNSRRLPRPDDRPVLVLLDEFARLGRAPRSPPPPSPTSPATAFAFCR